MRLTPAQMALIRRVMDGCGFLSYHQSPGALKGAWYVTRPYSEEDGRTCEGLVRKGALRSIGDGDYELTAEALAAMPVIIP